MNRLVSVIGPAPSEHTPLDFIERLKRERARMVGEIQAWRASGKVVKKRKTPAPQKVSEAFLVEMKKRVEEEVRKKLEARK